jgi:DNA primase
MGTAPTSEQVAILGRLARTVVVVFDGDTAPAAAAAIPMFVEEEVDGRIARMPAGIDPDDFVRQQGAEAFRRLLASARPMLDQLIQDVASDANIPSKVEALDSIAAVLVKVKNPTTRELYAGQLAGILRLEPQHSARPARRRKAVGRAPVPPAPQRPPNRLQAAPRGARGGGAAGAHPELMRTPLPAGGRLADRSALRQSYRDRRAGRGHAADRHTRVLDAAPANARRPSRPLWTMASRAPPTQRASRRWS